MPALQGHLPGDVICTFRAFLEFCYIARCDVITEDHLDEMEDALLRFHSFREVFMPIRPKGFSLPRQHSIIHYPALIRLFGAPNGICSSITESKHIRAVKEPWRRSSRNQALFQMLTTNQRLDQLIAARDDFTKRGMLDGTSMDSVPQCSTYYDHKPSSGNNLSNFSVDLPLHDEDKDTSDSGSFITEPSDAIEPWAGASIADEDTQAGITDGILAQVKFAQRCRESNSEFIFQH